VDGSNGTTAAKRGRGRGQRLLRHMLRAREAVVWLGMAWLFYGMVVLAVVLLAGPESTTHMVVEGAPTDVALTEGGGSLAGKLDPDRWTDGRTRTAALVSQTFYVLCVSSTALLVWLTLAVLACARYFGGTPYALGHVLLVLLGAPVLLLGPIWVPLLVADDVQRGHTARVRRMRNPTGMDVLAAGILAGLVAVAYLTS